MKRIISELRSKRKAAITVISVVLVLLVGFVDWFSGPEISLSVFYLVPVGIAAYLVNLRTGIVISLLCAVVYLHAGRVLSITYTHSAVPYWNSLVRLSFFLLVAYVLAKRKIAEERLSHSEERFRLLVEGIRDCAIFMLDADGRITNWNTGAERIFGHKAEEVIHRHVSCLYTPQDVAAGKPETDLQDAVRQGKLVDEGQRIRRDRKSFWADIILTPLFRRPGELRGFSILTRDMTERQQAEQTVRAFAALHEIDRAILAAQSSEEIAYEALQRLRKLIPFQAGSVSLLDLESGTGELIAVEGALPQSSFLLDTPEFDTLEKMKAGIPLVVEDRAGLETPWAVALPGAGLRSCMNVPLLSHGVLIGTLNLGMEQPHNFTEDELKTASQVASQVALALNSARLLEEVRAAHQRLRLLSQRLLYVQEMEKRHLARELHDEMGQALTALRIHLEEMDSLCVDARLSERCAEGIKVVEKLLSQVRSLSLNLRPLILDDLGLVAALRWYASRQAQLAGFSVHFSTDCPKMKLPAEVETACFRITQEALTNIVRHAKANRVNLEIREANEILQVTIKDDGIGFDLKEVDRRAAAGESLGLVGMRERAELLGGELELESFPNSGTQVRVRVPVPQREEVLQ